MPFKTYQLKNGGFATSDTYAPTDYVQAWDVSDADAAEIARGAELFVIDGHLVVNPLPPEPVPGPVVEEVQE